MRYAGFALSLLDRGNRLFLPLCMCCLAACSSTGLQQRPDMTAQADPALEARLQALEAGMQVLNKRVDALQSTMVGTQAAGHRADAVPAEYQALRPAVVLASSPVRTVPATPREPAPAPVPSIIPKTAPPETPVTPVKPRREGDWVINLASYKNRSYAARKQAEFAGKGVAVEQVRAEVRGKVVYRLRVPGFGTSRAANLEAEVIRNKLGLSDTWIARQ